MNRNKIGYTDDEILEASYMSEGTFYIVPVSHINNWLADNRASVVVHRCTYLKPRTNNRNRRKSDNLGLTYWSMPASMTIPCPNCKALPPEKIITVWKLQNMDYFICDLDDPGDYYGNRLY